MPDLPPYDPPEALPLLQTPSPSPSPVLLRLYASHALSTWTSRMFEFGAVLFLASIFPDTLLYASIYALCRSFSVVVLSAWLGEVVDRSDRLWAIRMSIVWQRIPVIASCVCFLFLMNGVLPPVFFAAAVLLACVEKLAATANTVAVERDWAIVVSDALHMPRHVGLELNASMRRIDLFCKLVAPVVISLVDGLSTRLAVWVVLGVNASCVLVEYLAIDQVYKAVPQLERLPTGESDTANVEPRETIRISAVFKQAATPWREYVESSVFLPSLALSLLYLTVLSFGPTMVTYLLHTSFTPLQVSVMRVGAVAAELSGTWAAPLLMNRIGPIRSGLWFLNWQLGSLAAAVAAFAWTNSQSLVVAASLIAGVALSRIGLWGFDLSVQYLVQENVEAHTRARFSATEMALQNIAELLSFATTIAFPRPEDFRYPVFISFGAITMAAVCFAAYVRKERGHLLHMSRCLDKRTGPAQQILDPR
ncbi:hypothetical protein P168DRAFT_269833 [Aspergillus campestris IBT 28561]|uniref:Solute carrier family 40 member n=1 Tax=Aspergillus campestris (strain IBT 28561) TaxID=1392248 RepID=A0A2I1D0Y3_ASPC2|nr:uncharacterized protein P168DRAFT_269833 [Aspergillus campestris IBT 28561]PKY03533.1 hypothetical protein P168DRAFT_269833 [Aspergillus campestris IBT 28561]